MGPKDVSRAFLIAVAVTGGLLWWVGDDPPAPPVPLPAPAVARAVAPAAVDPASLAGALTRVPTGSPPADPPRERFHGTVHDQVGAPIAGAVIRLVEEPAGTDRAVLAEEPTDAEGRFGIVAAPAWCGPFAIEAHAPGFLPAFGRPVDTQRSVELRLTRTAPLAGRVLAADTRALLADASITDGRVAVRSDASGAFVFPDARIRGETRLTVRCAGYVTETVSAHRSGSPAARMDILLQPGTSLTARVVDADSGAPIAGAEVRPTSMDENAMRTDVEGRFTLCVAEGHELGLVVTADGYGALRWHWQVRDPAAVTPRIPLLRSVTLEGWVTAAGSPVADATVSARSSVHPFGRRLTAAQQEALGLPGVAAFEAAGSTVRTDRRGYYRLHALPDESPQTVEVRREGHAGTGWAAVVVADAGSRARVDLALTAGGTIRGRVLRNGQPWRGEVHWRLAGRPDIGGHVATASGEYELPDVSEGVVELALRERGRHRPVQTAVAFVATGRLSLQDFVFDEQRECISGRVAAPGGQPLMGIDIEARATGPGGFECFRSRTDRDGSYRIEVGSSPTHTVRAVYGLVTREREGVVPGATGVDFVLPP